MCINEVSQCGCLRLAWGLGEDKAAMADGRRSGCTDITKRAIGFPVQMKGQSKLNSSLSRNFSKQNI
jgi:hypothetical protein